MHESKDEKVSRLEAYREGDEDLKRKYSELDESRGLSGRLDSAISIEELRLKTGKVKEQVKDEDNDETKWVTEPISTPQQLDRIEIE